MNDKRIKMNKRLPTKQNNIKIKCKHNKTRYSIFYLAYVIIPTYPSPPYLIA